MGQNNKELMKMMGMMAICCLLPIVLLGTVGTVGGISPAIMIGIVALCVVLHLFMMRGHTDEKQKEHGGNKKVDDNDPRRGSCH